MSLIEIPGALRNETGKGACRKLRSQGLIPGNLVEKGKSTPVQLDPKFLSKAWQSGKQFNLAIDGKLHHVKIIELQIDPIKRFAKHVDLQPV